MLYVYSSLLQIYEYLLQVVLYIGYFFIISLFNSVFEEVKGGALFHNNNATHFRPLSRLP